MGKLDSEDLSALSLEKIMRKLETIVIECAISWRFYVLGVRWSPSVNDGKVGVDLASAAIRR